MNDQPVISRRAFAGAVCALPLSGAAARAEERLKVSLVSTQGIGGLTIQDIVASQGYLADFGVDAEILTVSDATKAVAALVGRSADMCLWSGFGIVTAAIEKGARLKIIGGALLSPTYAVFSAKAGVRRVADLKGKTIGIGALGAQLHQAMLALMRKKDIAASDVTFRNVGSSTDVFRAVAAGTVDAGASEVDVLEQPEKYGVHALDDGNLWSEVPEFTFQATWASEDAIAHKRAALVRALAAFGKAYRFISSPDSQQAWTLSYQKASGRKDDAEALALWRFIQKNKPYATDLVVSPERVAFMQKLNLDLGVQKRILSYEEATDMSLAREAIALLG